MKGLYRIYFLVLIFAASFLPSKLWANHILGADLTWKHLKGDTVQFTLAVYRNCESLNISNTPFQYFDACATHPVIKTVQGTMCCTKDVTPDLGYGCSKCGSPTCSNPYGVQMILIQVKIKFPTTCCNWIVSWGQSARDGAITTGAAGENFYTECALNTCQKSPPDNSPFFNTPAVNITCKNTCTVLDNSATDIDRNPKNQKDSLVYSLVAPLQAHGVPVTYTNGYSYISPLAVDTVKNGTCSGFSIDKKTGEIQFLGLKSEITVIAIQVEEYRPDTFGNFSRIGTIRRDMEIINYVCPYTNIYPGNNPPIITGINGGSTYTLNICAGQSTCFTIKAFDLDPPDSVTISWDNGIPGANFTITPDGKKWPTATFCWIPKLSDTSKFPYVFKVYAQDNEYPPGKSFKTFLIYVSSGSPKAIYSAEEVGCGLVKFSAVQAPNSATIISSYVWSGDGAPGYGPLFQKGQTFRYPYNRGGTYHYSLTITGSGGCSVTYNDSIIVQPFLSVLLLDTIVCAKDPNIVLTPMISFGKPPYKYHWNTGDTSMQEKAIISSDTGFAVYVSDSIGCTNNDSSQIKFLLPPTPHSMVNEYTCGSRYIAFLATMATQVNWTKITGKNIIHNFSNQNPLEVSDSGIYIATALNSKICPGVDSFHVINVHQTQVLYNDTNVCINDSVTFNLQNYGSNELWIDSGSGYKLLSNSFLVFKNKTIGNYKLKFTQPSKIQGVTCFDTVIYTVIVHGQPKPILSPLSELCLYNPPVNLMSQIDKFHQNGGYWYYPRNPAAVLANSFYPSKIGTTANDTSAVYLHYHYTDQYKCTSDDSIRVIIRGRVSAGQNALVWKECGKYVLNSGNVHPRYGGSWTAGSNTPSKCIQYSGDTVFFNPSLVPGTGIYTFIYTYHSNIDSAQCSGVDSVQLNLIPKPKITIVPIDTICSNSTPVLLQASPAGGKWQFLDSTDPKFIMYVPSSNSYYFNPDSAWQGIHRLMYSFGYNNSNSCIDAATTQIYVENIAPVDFYTADHLWSYCSTHAPVELISTVSGGEFVGNGVYEKGNKWYLDPQVLSNLLKNTNEAHLYQSVYYLFQNPGGKCKSVSLRIFSIIAQPEIKITTDSVTCGVDNVFTLNAIIKNASQVSWSSPLNGQDGGNFSNQTNADSFYSINYTPAASQLKQKFFIVYLTAWADSICDSVHATFKFRIKPDTIAGFLSNSSGCDSFTTSFSLYNASFNILKALPNVIKYDWSFGDSSKHSFVENPTHTFYGDSTDFKTYNVSLSITTNEGCRETIVKPKWITVFGRPFPIITAVPRFTTLDRPTIQFGISPKSKNVNLNDSATTFNWNFGDTSNHKMGGHSNLKDPDYNYSDTGRYTVTLKVSNTLGCFGMDSEIAFIDIRPAFAIFIPNAFIPGIKKKGGFDVNSIFKPVVSSYSDFEMIIYNRFGVIVYNGSGLEPGWDGTYKGINCPEDAYIYNIKVKSIWGQAYEYKGSVTLLR